MADIKLGEEGSALWNEVGSRGDYFRRAVQDKIDEEVRVSGQVTKVTDVNHTIVEAIDPHHPDPTADEPSSAPSLDVPSAPDPPHLGNNS